MKKTTLLLLLVLIVGLTPLGLAQAPAPASAAPAAVPSAAAPGTPITDADLKGISSPDAKARANGDPDGGLTGTVADIAVADPITDKTPKAKGLTIGDVVNQIGQNKIAINFTWT
jgi:Amt family ammonium transporter